MPEFCAVCGAMYPAGEVPGEYTEDERFHGAQGAEMRIAIPYCNQSEECNAITAANTLTRLADPFFEKVGYR